MKTIEIKNRWSLEVIYSDTQENNSLRLTILKALMEGADLEGADLKGADLKGANLEGANLRGTNLRGTNLEGTNLRGTNLEGADLKGADLKGADLKGADLKGADLKGADLEGADLYQIVGCGSLGRCTTYDIGNDKIICGCFYGSLDQFVLKVSESYPKNKFKGQKGYEAAILFFQSIKDNYNGKEK